MKHFGFRISNFGLNAETKIRNSHSTIRNPAPWRSPAPAGGGSTEAGFTLLEVMVAVAILAMVLVSLLGVSNRSTEAVMLSDHITTATLLAKRVMTDTLMSGQLKETEDEGKFDEDEFKDYAWKKTVSPMQIEGVEGVTITEVRVAVLWKEGTRQEMVELKSYE
jgi:general secretion pathway protein I